MDLSRRSLEQHLAHQGLTVFGGFVPEPQDGLPLLPGDRPAAVVWMVGQAGSSVWPAFVASPEAQDGRPDPMDRWSQSIGDALAQALGGGALYPSDGPPWWPFQRWLARGAPVQPSPLMLQIHPHYGLWLACRFALLLPDRVAGDLPDLPYAPWREGWSDLCLQCDGQPCLQSCPVEAFDGQGFDVAACATHVAAAQGRLCVEQGCLARRACPVGASFRYAPDHAAFHMAAFVAARKPPGRENPAPPAPPPEPASSDLRRDARP